MNDEGTLGPCGCTDYHMADCSSGGAWLSQPYLYGDVDHWDDRDDSDLDY